MTSPSPHERIKELKIKLLQSISALQQFHHYLPIREKLDEEIHKLESSKQLSINNQKILNQLHRDRRKVDSIMDEGEDISEETLDKIREEIILAFSELKPQLSQEYDLVTSRITSIEKDLKELNLFQNVCSKLLTIFDDIFAIRHHVKRRGLLAYLIGKSPNQSIAEKFYEADLIIKKSLLLMNDYKSKFHDEKTKSLVIKLIEQINHLQSTITSRWGFQTIDKFLQNSKQEMLASQFQLTDIIDKMNGELDLLRSKKESLLNSEL